MLNLRDAFILTKSKLLARKGRSIGTAIMMSLGIVVLMSASFAAKGVENMVFDLLRAPTNDRWFTTVTLAEPEQKDVAPEFDPYARYLSVEQADRIATDMSARDIVVDTYVRTSIEDTFAFGLTTRLSDTAEGATTYSTFDSSDSDSAYLLQSLRVSTLDAQFMDPYVQDGYSLSERVDGRVPVLVPAVAALALQGYVEPRDPSVRRSQEEFEKKNRLLQDTIGLPVVLQRKSFAEPREEFGRDVETSESDVETTSIELVVVGVLPGDSFFGGASDFGTTDLLVGNVLHAEVASQLESTTVATSIIAEYASEDDMQADFLGEEGASFFSFSPQEIVLSQERVNVFPIADSKAVFSELLSFARNAGYWIGGFLLLISSLLVWMSLARIVRDSRREIGVFRAVGARKRDVVKIIFLYAAVIAVVAFVISSVLSVALTIGVSIGWGDVLFFQLASLGGISSVNPPAFAFFGVTPFTVLISVLATALAAFVGAFFPARKAAALDPVVALRDA